MREEELRVGEYYHTLDCVYEYIGKNGYLYDFWEITWNDDDEMIRVGDMPSRLTYNEVKHLKKGLA